MAAEAQPRSPLDPAVLDQLARLSLVARTVVEGFRAGHHRSPHRGSSVEFAQHREYVPGDDLRHIDWKIFARSERLVVKEFIEETNFTCHLLVDASQSMAFSSQKWNKLDYARWCAASLAHLILARRDSAGLVVFDRTMRTRIPPSSGDPQKAAILQLLEQAEPNGETAVGSVLDWLGSRLSRRGIAMVFSDFFDDLDRIVAGLRRLVHAGHEVILFQVLDPQELDFDYTGFLRLEDLESDSQVKVDPKAIRLAYQEEIRKHNEELARQARLLSLDHLLIRTDEPLDAVLSTYLGARAARVRGSARL